MKVNKFYVKQDDADMYIGMSTVICSILGSALSGIFGTIKIGVISGLALSFFGGILSGLVVFVLMVGVFVFFTKQK